MFVSRNMTARLPSKLVQQRKQMKNQSERAFQNEQVRWRGWRHTWEAE